MEKIASDKEITPKESAKIATAGFASLAGSPSTNLSPQETAKVASKFHGRVTSYQERHGKLRNVLLDHAKG